jgi:ribosomal protein S18 acetylase RimI-like enzyme
MVEIRQAGTEDIPSICSFDHLARTEDRRTFIQNSARSGSAYVAILNGELVGYTVLEYTFYSQGFITMLYVHPDHRRSGLASELVHHVESICGTEKLFTSTNKSNVPMQALMVKLGYVPSGIINNLDEGDPELVYFKRLHRSR